MTRILKRNLSLIICLLSTLFTYGQEDFHTQHFFTLRHDNDFFNINGHGTDRYYTGGLFLEYSYLKSAGGFPSKILYSPFIHSHSLYTIGIAQLIYTPEDLSAENAQRGDYPFCGILEAYMKREASDEGKNLFRSSLALGIIGPHAFAKQSQQVIHRAVNYIDPNGWKNQLPDWPIVNYDLYYERALTTALQYVGVNAWAATETGTLLNDARIGIILQVTNKANEPFPTRIYSEDKPSKAFHFYVQVVPAAKLVAENSILQGGFFGDKQYYHIRAKNIERVVLQNTLVIGLHFGRIFLEYKQVYNTREFKSVQAHTYGGISITWRT